MKSGNMIELFNLLSFKFDQTYAGSKTVSWKYHPDENSFNLMGGGTLDLDQIEAITHKVQDGGLI